MRIAVCAVLLLAALPAAADHREVIELELDAAGLGQLRIAGVEGRVERRD